MYNHNKAPQSKNRVHIYWDILYVIAHTAIHTYKYMDMHMHIYAYIHIGTHIYGSIMDSR